MTDMADMTDITDMTNTTDTNSPSQQLASFAAALSFDAIPQPVIRKTEDLLVDWFGSCVAGKGARAVQTIAAFAASAGPASGSAEVLISRSRTSAYFAAMVNAAASHVVEQDDVHNGSVFHPATVVFPVALALAQTHGCTGRQMLTAAVVGYEVGIRVGEFLGRSHYKVFHTTGTAGTLAAAATAGHLLGLNLSQMLYALGSAGTQAAGLWEFLRTAADSKQLHTAHAAAAGLMSASLAQKGFTGAVQILEGAQGMAAGMSRDADVEKLTDGLGTRWATVETSFKYHACCRHTHPAADALHQVLQTHKLPMSDVISVVAHVHQGAIDVLGPVVNPSSVHQSKFSMGTVLALVAQFGHAGLTEFDQHFNSAKTVEFCNRVSMALDSEVDSAYPKRWIGKVTVTTTDGRSLQGRVDEPKGDPGNTLSRDEITAKAQRLAAYSGGANEGEMRLAMERLWSISYINKVGQLLV
jgi:2-methylcitrate dehydratase PrpD